MPNVILFVDCDNQPAARSAALIDKIHRRIGAISCVFLAGNSHGEQVAKWKKSLNSRIPKAIIESIAVKNRKESADVHFILKMGRLCDLFGDHKSVRIVVATDDAHILSAAEVIAESGMIIFSANINDPAIGVSALARLDKNEPESEGHLLTAGERQSTDHLVPINQLPARSVTQKNKKAINWRGILFGQCPIHSGENNSPYVYLVDAASLLVLKYGIQSRETRKRILSTFRLVKMRNGLTHIY